MSTPTVCPPSTPVGPRYQANTVTVLLPEGMGHDWASITRRVAEATDETARSTDPIFPVRNRRLWQRLLHRPDTALGRVRDGYYQSWCSGGRMADLRPGIRRIRDLAQARAMWDYAYWKHTVAGTPTALSLEELRDRYDGKQIDEQRLYRQYEAQPRVRAMRIANMRPNRPVSLEEENLPILQTSATAYITWQVMAALPGDEVITIDGTWLFPSSDRFADRIDYLQQANGHIDRLAGSDTLVRLRR